MFYHDIISIQKFYIFKEDHTMADKITDIRTSTNQLTQISNLIIEALPDEHNQFLICAKISEQNNFVLEIFAPARFESNNFKVKIICSISVAQLRSLCNSGRFRLDGSEVYPGRTNMFFYLVTYFK